MTVRNQQVENQTTSPTPTVWDEEIDLREYILTIGRWWREILCLTLLTVVIAVGVLLFRAATDAPTYRASATVAIVPTKSEIQFDERFRTLSGEEIEGYRSDLSSRRSALVALVSNPLVAEAVLADVEALPEESDKSIAQLLTRIEAGLIEQGNNDSDLIRITATADSPEMAAAIANAWAMHYVQQVNRLYGQLPNEVLASVEEQLHDAEETYEQAQGQLETFIAGSEIGRLQRTISETVQILDTYSTAELEVHLAALTNDREARLRIYESLADAELNGLMAVLENQVEENLSGLQQMYSKKTALERLHQNAKSLQIQIRDGGEAAATTNYPSLLLLKAEIFADVSSLPANLQLNIDTLPGTDLTAEAQAEDIAALIDALDQRLSELDQQIEQEAQTLLAGEQYQFLEEVAPTRLAVSGLLSDQEQEELGRERGNVASLADAVRQRYLDLYDLGTLAQQPSLLAADAEQSTQLGAGPETPLSRQSTRLARDLQALMAQLEKEQARHKQLVQARDLAWNTWNTLQNKHAEFILTATAINSEVRFAAPAVPPLQPVQGLGLVQTTALAAALGLMVAVCAALFAHFMGIEPVFSGRRQRFTAAAKRLAGSVEP